MQLLVEKRDVVLRTWYIGMAFVIAGALYAFWGAMPEIARAILLAMNVAIVAVVAFQEVILKRLGDWKKRFDRSKPAA
jgi:hypothetical protein